MIPFARVLKYGNIVDKKVEIKQIASNLDNFFILYNNGELYGFGRNSQGNLGTGDRVAVKSVTLLSSDVESLWVGSADTMIYKTDGKFYYCGQGLIGYAANTPQNSFTECTSLFNTITYDDIKTIDLGASNLTVLLKNGDLYVSGSNSNGQYGNGDAITVRYQTLTKILSSIKEIKSNGNYAMFCIKSDDKLYGAGSNSENQLGMASKSNYQTYSPSYTASYPAVTMDQLTTFRLGAHLNISNNVMVTGTNNNGALGNGINSATNQTLFNSTISSGYLPLQNLLRTFRSLSNYTSGMFLCTDGMYITGYGGYAQIGNGFTNIETHFTKMTSLDDYVQDYTKIEHALVNFYASYVVYEGKLYACGGNSSTSYEYCLPGYTSPQRRFVPIELPY